MVNRSEAIKKAMVSVSKIDGLAYIGVDHTSVITGNNSRDTLELHSRIRINGGLVILNVRHMPIGCGTWPAFWTYGDDWPNQGEIDIVEGINTNINDITTLHTGPHCDLKFENTSNFTGTWALTPKGGNATNCYYKAPNQFFNQGCSIISDNSYSYGYNFNKEHGGVFAMLWNETGIAMWFFQRKYLHKYDVNTLHPTPSSWGKPYAFFQFSDKYCPSNNFINHKIVFDTQFCGDWVKSYWKKQCSKLGNDCTSFVRNNPAQFKDAFWLVQYVRYFK